MALPKQLQQMLMNVFVQVTGIDSALFNRSAQFYGPQEKVGKAMNEFVQRMAMESQDRNGKIIENDQCIKAIRRMEEAKIVSIDTLQKQMQSGQVPQQMVPMIMEIDKCRAIDKLFLEQNIDDDDIGKTVRANKLQENPEFQAMIKECQAKMQAAQQTWAH